MAEEIELSELQLEKKKLLIEKWSMLPEEAQTIAIADDYKEALKAYKDKKIEEIKVYVPPKAKIGDVKTDKNFLLEFGSDKKIMSDAMLEAQEVLIESNRSNIQINKEIEDSFPPGATVGPMISINNLFDSIKTNSDALSYDLQLRLRGFDTSTGVDDHIRTILSFSFRDKRYQTVNLKQLIKEKLIKDDKLTEKFYTNNPNGIQVKTYPLYDGSDVMVWRVMPVFGGDGLFRPVNEPGIERGDFNSMARGSIEFGTVMASFIGGSIAGGPIIGGPIAAGLARWAIGVKTDLIGKYKLGLQAPSDEEIRWSHMTPALIEVGAGAVLGKVFQMMKSSAMGEAKVDLADVKHFIKQYTEANPGTKKTIGALKKTLINEYKISKDKVDEYLAVSMAQMFPNIELGFKLSPIPKAVKQQIDEVTRKSSIAAEVESAILKKFTKVDVGKIGAMDSVDSLYAKLNAADKVWWDSIGSTKQKYVRDAIAVLKGNKVYNPTQNYIDRVGIQVSQLIKNINNQKNFIDEQILTRIKQLNIKIPISDSLKKEAKTFNNIIQGNMDSVMENIIGRAPIKPKDYLTNKVARALYDKNLKIYTKERNVFAQYGVVEFKDIQKRLKSFHKILTNTEGPLTYQNLLTLKSFILNAELTSKSVIEENALRQVKGVINNAIYNIGVKSGDNDLIKLISNALEIKALQKNTMINEIVKSFGYVAKKGESPVNYAMSIKGENVFLKYFADSVAARENAKMLGRLLNDQLVKSNVTMRNTIKGSAYEYYQKNVINGTMKHGDFMKKHGANMKAILGNEEYSQFVKNSKTAQNIMKNFYTEWGDNMSIVARWLQIDPKIPLADYTPEFLATQVLKMGNMVNMKAIKKALGVRGFKSVQNNVVKLMFEQTSVMNNLTQVPSYNGALLFQFIKKNQALLRNTFGDEFVTAHTQLSRSLMLLQDTPEEIIKRLDPSLTQATSLYGKFIDIVYGPLNHKRLILNRMSNIYDHFDIDATTYSKLLNYQLYIENAKKNFIMGSYPRVLDKVLKNEKQIKNFRNMLFKYTSPRLWDNRNVWNVGGPFAEQFKNLIGYDVLKPIGVAKEIIKKPNWSLISQRIGVEEIIDSSRDSIPGEADLLETIEAPLEWSGKKSWEGIKKTTSAVGDIISNIFDKGDQKLPETKLIEEKLKEINNPSIKKKKDSILSNVKKDILTDEDIIAQRFP